MKALYGVVVILTTSILFFFLGDSPVKPENITLDAHVADNENFFYVFTIIFPAFTGLAAGLGLSGDLKDPKKSIPKGTLWATFIGMLVYIAIAWKFTISATPEELVGNQLIMGEIALWGPIVPIGLAAASISSALGSIIVAPRTLQAIGFDDIFPQKTINRWFATGKKHDNEPVNASLITVIIAFVFVIVGDVNFVAQIISMFFMVTYGSLCLISFLNHFGSSPSYRPSFRSRWYISLTGFVVAVWVMFKISTVYALVAFVFITLIYLYVDHYHKNRKGFASIFANSLFQLNRNLQVMIQKKQSKKEQKEWRPSAICISKASFKRDKAFRLLNWISYKYGFGTYLHQIDGYYSKSTAQQAREEHKRLLEQVYNIDSQVYIDTLISPSNTSAIAQAIQIPGIAGMENNMVIFEYDKEYPKNLPEIIDNFALVNSGDFDIAVLASSPREIKCINGIHVWINSLDTENANLMILLSFIILGHPDWKKGQIQIFNICREEEVEKTRTAMKELVLSGRLPIAAKNIKLIVQNQDVSFRTIINKNSANAGLTLIGLREEMVKKERQKLFEGYDELGTVLFVYSKNQKEIE